MKNYRLVLYRLKRKIINSSLSFYSWRDKILYFLGIRKAESGSMPDFIIAGLPKCGTVWLVEALDADENIEYVKNPFYSHKKEIRFFSLNFNQPISKYLKTFKSRRTVPNKLLFEKSPDYSTMGLWRIRLIKKLNPSIKIILIFRDPVKRCFSNTKMDLIRVKQIELKPENDPLFFKSYKSQIRKYNYQKILTNWFRVFNESQILVLSMEDIKDRPQQVLKKTYRFLGRNDNNAYINLNEAKNTTVAAPIPLSHRQFMERELADTIKFWNNNQKMFRL